MVGVLKAASEPTIDASARGLRQAVGVALVAAGSMATSIVVALAVFPYGSVNDDEAIYRLQAHTLAAGHLFPAAPDPAMAFRPWLAALAHHHYVLKYTPVEAAVLAASHLLAGSYIPGLAATVAAVVIVTWLLASELLADRQEALVATALVAGSPLVVIQSGLLLGYLTTLALLELFAWTAVRGVRQGSGWWFVPSGLAFGIACAIRSYDALLFGAPFLVWTAARLGRKALLPGACFLIGGLGPLAAFLVYNDMATGSPLKLAFNLQESHDTIGYGLRRLNPTEDLHRFGPLQGVAGMGAHLGFLLIWVGGGPILIALAMVAIRRGQLRGPCLALAATALTLPGGYLIYWGPWNAATIWGGIRLVGPFYVLPLVVVAAILGARGLSVVGRRHPHWTRRLIPAMAAVTIVAVAPVVAADARYSRQDGQVAALTSKVPGPALIVLRAKPGFIMFPHYNLGQIGPPGGPTVFAAATGTSADFELLNQFSDRIPYAMTFSGSFLPHAPHVGAQLNRLVELRGPTLDLRVQASKKRLGNKRLTLTVTAGGPVTSCGRPDAAGGWSLQLHSNGDTVCTGATGSVLATAGPVSSVKLKYSSGSGSEDETDIPERISAGNVSILLPGPQAAILRHVTLPMFVGPAGSPAG